MKTEDYDKFKLFGATWKVHFVFETLILKRLVKDNGDKYEFEYYLN